MFGPPPMQNMMPMPAYGAGVPPMQGPYPMRGPYPNNGMGYYPQFPEYGGMEGIKPIQKTSPFSEGNRRRLNIVPVILCILLPTALFAGLYAVMSFTLRYSNPAAAYSLLWVTGLAVLISACFACRSMGRKAIGDPTRQPNWYVFLFLSMLIAWVLAFVLGEYNFENNMEPFYDAKNLNTFTDVNPSRFRGQQVMDAGVVEFTQGTKLDLQHSMGFKSEQVYCVAPIVLPSETPAQYDFWAVGTDCCSGSQADFHCKNFNNPHSNGALRLTKDHDRAMYRLAVQQAEATYRIKATHPLFFTWVVDPVEEMWSYQRHGIRLYLAGLFGYFLGQSFLVAAACVAFSKMGYY